jgi:[protein-PII] uridylyltransferase
MSQQNDFLLQARNVLQASENDLRRRFDQGDDVVELIGARARSIDALLENTWNRYLPGDAGAALVAVGGYGRGELHPHSDIDLLIVLDEQCSDQLGTAIGDFLTLLWDIGLEVGHSVRTVEECVVEASRDVTVATNLMEARLVAGRAGLFGAMREATGPDRIWPSRQFFEAKWLEQTQRHAKLDDTYSNLEPNIKKGPGGLRDVQMIGWVAKRHFGGETLFDLVLHGFLTEQEYQTLVEGQLFLWRIRFALHLMCNRAEERLLFDYQRALAKRFGYTDQPHTLAVEQFMQRYYRTILELGRLSEMLLQLFQEAILLEDRLGPPTAGVQTRAIRTAGDFSRPTTPPIRKRGACEHHSPDSRPPAPDRRKVSQRHQDAQPVHGNHEAETWPDT